MHNMLSKFSSKIKTVIEHNLQRLFINSLFDRQARYCCQPQYFPADDNYWPSVAQYLYSVAETSENDFFRDPVVVIHLASNDIGLGYRIIHKIKKQAIGNQLLFRCNTPTWGSPYLLRKYPNFSPTTTTHIANIASIILNFGSNFDSIIEFGGGYGGFSRCMTQYNNSVSIYIVDHDAMLKIQSKYINSTLCSHNCFFQSDVSQLTLSKYSVFNASFSYSEIPLESRPKIEDFILEKCNGIHIIFQKSFYEIDNLSYMKKFKSRLESNGWSVSIGKYGWYDWDDAYLLVGRTNYFAFV